MPACTKCHVLTSTSKRCPYCRICYCSKAWRSTDWSRHKSECVSGEKISSDSASSTMASVNAFSDKGHELPSFCDEYRRMYPSEPHGHYVRLNNLRLLVHSQLNFLNIMNESLCDLCRMPGFGLKRFGIISYNPYNQLDLDNKRAGDLIEMSCATWSEQTSQTFENRPSRFIGVDCSLYAVVKALILIKLFETGAAPKHIAQIWFSSAWNTDTFQSFRSAIQACLLHGSDNSAITNVLQYWIRRPPVSRSEARSKWLALHSMEENLFGTVPNLTNAEDRSHVAHYLMTGELFIEPGSLVGNLMLFTDYHEFNTHISNQTILNRLPLAELIGNAPHNTCFWKLVENYLFDGVTRLRRMIYEEHQLQVQVSLGMIELTNTALIDRLKALDPTSISWSNIIDYNQPRKFHQLAKRLSGVDTCHHGYSLNHSQRVFGTHLCDFTGQTRRKQIVADAKRECQSLVHEYNWVGAQCLTSNQEPISDYRNITCYYLTRKYGVQQWLDNYFRTEEVHIDRHELEPYSTFSETIATCHLTWRYPTNEHRS